MIADTFDLIASMTPIAVGITTHYTTVYHLECTGSFLPIALATISPTIRLIPASRVLLTAILARLTESVQAAAILTFDNCLMLLYGVFLS